MKKDFLVEIGVEEIPASFIEPAVDSFHMSLTEKLRAQSVGRRHAVLLFMLPAWI